MPDGEHALPNQEFRINPADGLPMPIERGAVIPAPPPTPENLLCLTGPCRHYCDAITSTDDVNTDWEMVRVCEFWSRGEEHDDLSEQAVRACQRYRPPWWSLAGWLARRRNARLLRLARRWTAGKATGAIPPDAVFDQWDEAGGTIPYLETDDEGNEHGRGAGEKSARDD